MYFEGCFWVGWFGRCSLKGMQISPKYIYTFSFAQPTWEFRPNRSHHQLDWESATNYMQNCQHPTFNSQPLMLVVKTQFEKKTKNATFEIPFAILQPSDSKKNIFLQQKKILPIFSGPLRSPCRVPKRFWALAVAKGWIPTNEASNLRGEKCDDDDSNNNNNNNNSRNRDAGFKGNWPECECWNGDLMLVWNHNHYILYISQSQQPSQSQLPQPLPFDHVIPHLILTVTPPNT